MSLIREKLAEDRIQKSDLEADLHILKRLSSNYEVEKNMLHHVA